VSFQIFTSGFVTLTTKQALLTSGSMQWLHIQSSNMHSK
jgi:hypothetical protein